MKQLKDNIYFVGAMNPNLRVFDIIMRTEYGTSYNAYIVKGPEKTVLIDTVHSRFEPFFLESIKEIVPLDKLDAIVVNHSEPDHAGSIRPLVDANPSVPVYATAAAVKNIGKIINRDFNGNVVKNGDKLDLGGDEYLEFIPNPNVHWPDTMFTYYPAKKTVFTCDFLGAHYCEPTVTDDFISYEECYWKAFREYYDAIMSPFKRFVLAGLDKLEKLDFDMVCNSHGPILKHRIEKAKELYREWSQDTYKKGTAAIFYTSAYGYTETIAYTLKEELENAGKKVVIFDIINHDTAELVQAIHDSEALLFGSPTINRDAVRPVWDIMASVDPISNKGKPCLVFGSYGWSGEAVPALIQRAKSLGLKVYDEPVRTIFRASDEEIVSIRKAAGEFVKMF